MPVAGMDGKTGDRTLMVLHCHSPRLRHISASASGASQEQHMHSALLQHLHLVGEPRVSGSDERNTACGLKSSSVAAAQCQQLEPPEKATGCVAFLCLVFIGK